MAPSLACIRIESCHYPYPIVKRQICVFRSSAAHWEKTSKTCKVASRVQETAQAVGFIHGFPPSHGDPLIQGCSFGARKLSQLPFLVVAVCQSKSRGFPERMAVAIVNGVIPLDDSLLAICIVAIIHSVVVSHCVVVFTNRVHSPCSFAPQSIEIQRPSHSKSFGSSSAFE